MAYTEFYCNASTGSNLNGGSDAGAVTYTSTNGNWNGTTIFTPTDSSNPVAQGVTIGQFASVYIDGATVGVFIAYITAVTNATNGTITVSSTAKAGTPPTSLSTTRSIKVGGAFKGPNAASSFPFNLALFANATDSTGNPARLNMKNNSTYSVTASVNASGLANCVIQGYSSSVGDGGKAIIDGSGITTIDVFTGVSGYIMVDMIISNSAASGSGAGISDGSNTATYIRVVSHGHRGSGFIVGNSFLYECEAYANNGANGATTGNRAGFTASGAGTAKYIRCYSHDNTGSNAYGFECNSGNIVQLNNCIAESNGNDGCNFLINNVTGNSLEIFNSDFYNNGGDGIGIDFNSGKSNSVLIENCNLIKNTGKGINNSTAVGKVCVGLVYNCGYGAGTQANSGGDSTLGTIEESGKIIYASNVTPWFAPTTGDFRINLASANCAGRAVFTQTDGTNTGSVGFPDIGAVQSKTGPGGTFTKEVSYGFA